MLGVDASVSILVLREVVVQGLLAVLLAIPLYPLIRRILRPALIDYEPARRLLVPGRRRRRRGAPRPRPRARRRAHRARRCAEGLPDVSLDPRLARPADAGAVRLRVAVLGGIALVAFAIIFLRLWYLEVLSGDQYLAEAQNNQVREFTVQAPRGEILDRFGQPWCRTAPRSSCSSSRPSCRARVASASRSSRGLAR